MSEGSGKLITMLFPYKFLIILTIVTLFFNNCKPDKVKPGDEIENINSDSIMAVSAAQNTPLKNMFGVNGYEWNFLQDPANPNLKSHIYEANMSVIKSFSAVRHYMNWNKLENTKGNYTYNPTNNGSWDYDLIYTRCKQEGILVLADLKNCPTWLVSTYPQNLQDDENVPAPYGPSRSDPATYADQARTAFQFAARYGYNASVNPALVKVDSRPRWTNDPPNEVKIGLGLIKYIECDNERDKWWKSDATKQTPEEYAANMSAFYDGNKGKLGNNAGVKTADPAMQVVMGGLATADVNYVKRMIEWCKTNRGYRANGSIDLCFDVINYHLYSNDGNILQHSQVTTGVAPELSTAGSIANSFAALSISLPQHPEVWVTENGFDINQQSYQKAIAIGKKSVLLTQADWILRSSLLYIRHGVKRLFFYQLLDDTPNGITQYATSGLAEDGKRRPAADYILQANKLMGDYTYKGTINKEPIVDKYQSGNSTIYVLTIPDQKGRTASYQLNTGTASATVYTPKPGADVMDKKAVTTNNGKLEITVSETPLFVETGSR
ncbi:hypothetical protein SNE25_17610 [Mucilaginibacter sabulilitoris]|uniref:Glycoside hydrolase family 42 N-terminal domain-containing protein n=1 Tax=Mucilaginibacter sabulilitoris TaxID=1173583 RepID=A0ABZ0TD44_9SPHI|nr:hypothetical protein [Mucilaginibacter sabulilitoris]WPU91139.1 hypothetical protein SNE25_17610 [Mucilaginibacter sabulilitoris]